MSKVLTKAGSFDATWIAEHIGDFPEMESTFGYARPDGAGNVDFHFNVDVTPAITTELDAFLDEYAEVYPNAPYACQIKSAIALTDGKTDQLIHNGFSFAGNDFSLSLPAQTNWQGLVTMFNAGIIDPVNDFPYEVSTKEGGTAFLADATELLQFAGTAAVTVGTHLHDGRVIRDALNAIDLQAVDVQAQIDAQIAINDAR